MPEEKWMTLHPLLFIDVYRANHPDRPLCTLHAPPRGARESIPIPAGMGWLVPSPWLAKAWGPTLCPHGY